MKLNGNFILFSMNVALRHKGEHKSLVSKKFFNNKVGTNAVRVLLNLFHLRFFKYSSRFWVLIFVVVAFASFECDLTLISYF